MGINRLHLGMIVRFASSSMINDSDEMLGYKSSSFSPVPLIEDRALRFSIVAREEEASRNAYHLVFIERSRCSHMFAGIH